MLLHNHSSDDDRLTSLGLSVRAYNYCLRNSINSVSSLLQFYEHCDHTIPPGANAGKTTVMELERICKYLSSESHEGNSNSDSSDNVKKWGLSTRAYNYCISSRIQNKADLINLYLSNNRSIPSCANAGAKTIRELEDLCQAFIDNDPTIIDDYTENKGQSIEKLCVEILELTDSEQHFLFNFSLEHSHIPVLWLLSKIIDQDADMSCFGYAYGIDKKKGVKTISTLAQEMGVTQSRIGQRVGNGHDDIFHISEPGRYAKGSKAKYPSIFNEGNTKYLSDSIGDLDVICSCDNHPKVRLLNTSEKTSFSDAFVLRLISSFSDHYLRIGDFTRNNTDTGIILVDKELSNIFDFKAFYNWFEDYINNIPEKVSIDLRENIEDSPYWHMYSSRYVERVLKACKQILLSKFGLYDEDCDNIYHLAPKKIDLGVVVYNIIINSKSPLTLTEISDELIRLYPTNHFSEETIRIAIRDDKRIQYQRDGTGKTKYLPAKIDVPTGVRDAIVRVLEKSDIPVSLDEIVDFVTIHFPSTSKNSIRTTMLSDGRSRFVQYEQGRYGLASKTYPPVYVVSADASRASYDERVIELKNFLNDRRRFPSAMSKSSKEASLARWMDRNKERDEVASLVNTYATIVWESTCKFCESYITSHHGHLPTKEKAPELYKWLVNAIEQFKNGQLSQSQKKLYLHLTMVIKNRHA